MENLHEHYLNWMSEEIIKFNGKKGPRVGNPMKYGRQGLPKSKTGQFIQLETLDWENVWVWSDQHFGHNNIIRFAERPFMNVDEMNETLIENFNDYVEADHVSIWVGDVAFLNDTKTNEILDQLNGYKILVIGNHDFGRNRKLLRELNFDETHLCYFTEDDNCQYVFTHYPIALDSPIMNLHGHEHYGSKEPHWSELSLQHFNVNCEYQAFKPIRLGDIAQMAKLRLMSM